MSTSQGSQIETGLPDQQSTVLTLKSSCAPAISSFHTVLQDFSKQLQTIEQKAAWGKAQNLEKGNEPESDAVSGFPQMTTSAATTLGSLVGSEKSKSPNLPSKQESEYDELIGFLRNIQKRML